MAGIFVYTNPSLGDIIRLENLGKQPEKEVGVMKIMDYMKKYGHEELVFCSDPQVGLNAIIAIHDTTLGPALGGARMWPYKSEDEAMLDVLRLSRAMTYMASAALLNLRRGQD